NDRNWKNENSPCVRSGGESQKEARDQARNGAIQMPGNETILGLAAIAEEFLFDLVDLFSVRDVAPHADSVLRDQLRRAKLDFPQIFPGRSDLRWSVPTLKKIVCERSLTLGSTSLRK